jgi:translation initiation factor IF-3
LVNELKINTQIKAKTVRLIDENGQMIGIVPIAEALEIASNAELDLIEISPDTEPPVCKIGNYGKIRYQMQKKSDENRKKQKAVELKEIKMSPNIGTGDYDTKMKQARKFFMQGNKVKFNFKFRGREILHTDLVKEMIDKMITELSDVSKVEFQPKLEEKKMFFVLSSTVKK